MRGGWIGILAVLAAPAAGQVPCSSLPNPVFLQVGDTQEPVIKALGRALRDSAVQPMTLVYLTQSSCTNVEAFYTDARLAVTLRHVPSTAEDPGWDPRTSASPTCTPAAGGHRIDLANSALFVSACNAGPPPSGVAIITGPVQAYTLVVPEASTQVAITAEEAYFVFGFGAAGQVQPWNDESKLLIRPSTTSTLLTWAANLGIPAARWKGVRRDRSGMVVSDLQNAQDPERTIGILGAEVYDLNRGTLDALAFRAYRQRLAYFPDSSSTAFDKENVRNGHYTVWSPTEWLARVDGAGTPVDPRVRYLVDALVSADGPTPPPEFDALSIVISKGLVPSCAMRVTRSVEGGDLSLYQPPRPCHCFYESQVGAPGAACTACSATSPCATGTCRRGFCEER